MTDPPGTATVATAPNETYAFAAAFFEELGRAGVRHVCVSPGSRSTPLAALAARQPLLRCWSHVDERSGAFFALGLARATRAPVALVCTSGTAAANFLPAVVESHYARIPLLLLTADRPPELRDWDAGQTIDQLKLFGSHVRWFAELPVPEAGAALLRYARSLACRAVAESRGHAARAAGPVHLNWPLREPLEPAPARDGASRDWGQGDPSASEGRSLGLSYTTTDYGVVRPAPELVEELRALAVAQPRGVIACGPSDRGAEYASAVTELARAAGWPVLADPASQLRCGAHTASGAPVIANTEFLLRDGAFAEAHAPEVVLRLGATPVSKAFRLWLERRPPAELLVVDPEGGWSDPSHLASRVLAVDPAELCREWASALNDGGAREDRESHEWLADFARADASARDALDRELAAEERLLEPRAVRELCDALPDDALLYVSNSMPVRHLDCVLPVSQRRLRVLANRGANGIDGMVSSALGAAAAGVGPVVLLTGDLALIHDLGGLLAARRHGLRAAIVVLDNDGGGIFSFLPIASYGEEVSFEELFRTPHGLDLRHAAALFGASYERVTSWEHYRAALKDAFSADGLSMIHVPVDRDDSVEHVRTLAAAVTDAVRRAAAW